VDDQKRRADDEGIIALYRKVKTPVIIAALIWMGGAFLGLRDNDIRHQLQITRLLEFESKGPRYTVEDAKREREYNKQIIDSFEKQIDKITENQNRMWKAIRDELNGHNK
jgi:hypothetical protein